GPTILGVRASCPHDAPGSRRSQGGRDGRAPGKRRASSQSLLDPTYDGTARPIYPTNTPLVVVALNGPSEVEVGAGAPARPLPRSVFTWLGWPAPLPTTRSARLSASASTVATEISACPLSPLTE